MNGTGNDFVVLDARAAPLALTTERIRHLADRGNPVTHGCDQVVVLEPASLIAHRSSPSSAFMRIYNADGSESGACGNATRCVAWLLMRESGATAARIETRAGVLACANAGPMTITVDMGVPRFAGADIPTTGNPDDINAEGLTHGLCVNMGNPHVVFFVPDAERVDLATIGPRIEHNTALFPERVNVSVASVRGGDTIALSLPLSRLREREAALTRSESAAGEGGADITLRTWERGAGLTLACGTAACATLVAAATRGLCGRSATIHMRGGDVHIHWHADGRVHMTGPVALEHEGVVATQIY